MGFFGGKAVFASYQKENILRYYADRLILSHSEGFPNGILKITVSYSYGAVLTTGYANWDQ